MFKKIKEWLKNYKLCRKYPFLRMRNVWTGKKYGYEFTELDFLPWGWYKKFGEDICKDLLEVFKKSKVKHFEKQYHITQIKEKYRAIKMV